MRAILLAGGLSLLGTLLGTRAAIAVLVRKGYGQLIRDDGPTSHHTKRGTPTMGGLIITVSAVAGAARARRCARQLARADGPPSHHTKRGTPTMGGLIIIVSVVAGYALAKLLADSRPSASALLLLFLFTGLGLVGFLDDYIKISKQRSLGLRSKAKFGGQTLIALAFALLALRFPDENGRTPISHGISFIRDINDYQFPAALIIIWVLVIIAGTSNGV